MDNVEYFDNTGSAVCYSPDGEHIFLWTGKPVAFLHDGKVYSFTGRQLGWFENGWLYDRSNRPALFSKSATGGPVRPARRAKPAKNARLAKPAKLARQAAIARPARSLSWSGVADASYFYQ